MHCERAAALLVADATRPIATVGASLTRTMLIWTSLSVTKEIEGGPVEWLLSMRPVAAMTVEIMRLRRALDGGRRR